MVLEGGIQYQEEYIPGLKGFLSPFVYLLRNLVTEISNFSIHFKGLKTNESLLWTITQARWQNAVSSWFRFCRHSDQWSVQSAKAGRKYRPHVVSRRTVFAGATFSQWTDMASGYLLNRGALTLRNNLQRVCKNVVYLQIREKKRWMRAYTHLMARKLKIEGPPPPQPR